MSLLDDVESIPRRTMHLFFLADVSGSMRGAKIGAVNDAIRNVLPIVSEISDNNPDAEIKIAALTFSDGTMWVYNEPKAAADFEWIDQNANGGTDLGEACIDLEQVLHKTEKGGWMSSGSGSFAPVFILLSDGGPTDDYLRGIEILRRNNWFKAGIKVAIAIGEDADYNVLEKFAGERVIRVHDIETLKKVIRVVVITSSQVGSSSASASTSGKEVTKEDEVTEAIKQQLSQDNVEIGVDASSYNPDEFD